MRGRGRTRIEWTMKGRHLFLLKVSLFLVAHVASCLSCRNGTHSECEAASFIPGYNLAGEGFDKARNKPKGAYVVDVKTYMTSKNTCRLCKNPYLPGEVYKKPVSAVDWVPLRSCIRKSESNVYQSVESVIHSLSASNTYNWGGSVDIFKWGLGLQASQSEMAAFATAQDQSDKMAYITNTYNCRFYSYRLSADAAPSTEFSKDIQRLPRELDEHTRHAYMAILDTYGTHYIHQVRLGGSVSQVTAYRTCLVTLSHSSETDIRNAISTRFAVALGFAISPNVNFGVTLSNMESQSEKMGFYEGFMRSNTEVHGGTDYHPDILQEDTKGAFERWVHSLKTMPAIISHTLVPIWNMVKDPHIRENIKKAVDQYEKENELPVYRRRTERCSYSRNVNHNCCPHKVRFGRLEVTVQSARGLHGDDITDSDGFVKVQYGDMRRETHFVQDTNNPNWNVYIDFRFVDLDRKLTFEIWDKDPYEDDLLATCHTYVEKGSHGHSCNVSPGQFYYSYTVTCDSHLTGNRCQKYKPM